MKCCGKGKENEGNRGREKGKMERKRWRDGERMTTTMTTRGRVTMATREEKNNEGEGRAMTTTRDEGDNGEECDNKGGREGDDDDRRGKDDEGGIRRGRSATNSERTTTNSGRTTTDSERTTMNSRRTVVGSRRTRMNSGREED